MNINRLFTQVFHIAYEVQRSTHSGQQIDGKRVWQEIEKSVEHINIPEMNYKESLNDIYEMMDIIIDKYCMEINEYYPKSNHFFMQLKNLVVKKSKYIIKLNRILQLAYNAGQLKYFLDSSEYNTLDQIKDIKNIYDNNNLNNLNTYISFENIEIINQQYAPIELSIEDQLIIELTNDTYNIGLQKIKEYFQHITMNNGYEGIMLKPDYIEKDKLQMMKCRNIDYLTIIYGYDYMIEPKLTRLIKSKTTGCKIKQSINEFNSGMKILQTKYNDINTDNIQYQQLIMKYLFNEEYGHTIDPRL
jgi:hypothetical protein